MTQNKIIDSAIRTIRLEEQAIHALGSRLNSDFEKACELILAAKGRVIVSGMGKSGHIANKIASTLASTGTPAFFVHPGEASHGDLGMITSDDVVLALSNSGTTSELVMILPVIKRIGAALISMTGNPDSTLARAAEVNLDISVEQEACPLGLAPTSSTTTSLVMGDALAIALLEARGFTADDFAFSHPSGALGRKLLLKVEDVMHGGSQLPAVSDQATLGEALLEMTAKGLGMTTILDTSGHLCGVYTDGDLRRTLDRGLDIHQTLITDVMTTSSKTISPGMLAAEALLLMETNKISSLITVDQDNKPLGVVHLHDLLRAGVA